MLILTRRIGETLIIEPAPGIDPDMTVRELFERGPVVIALLGTKGNQSRIGIEAPDCLHVVRNEIRGQRSGQQKSPPRLSRAGFARSQI